MAESNTNPNTPLPLRLYDLIDQYQLLESSGEINELNETSIREQFLNPFLEELGWDPRNRRGVPPIQRDVVLEDKLLVDGSVKAPDYGMIINNKRVFYVEAKRPSVNVEYSTAAAYQIRRYSWSANLPLGLLSDFEEFAIYDCRQMPKPDDDPKTGRLLYFKYTELPEKWDDIYSLFSKNAVEHGSLENFVNSSKEPINTRPIDEAFLSEIRSWRISIAENIAKHNASLTESQLNRAVQLLLDRIIFLRIAEARGLEQVEGLRQAAISNGKTYDALIEMFQRADERYNSGLFHLSGEDSHNEEIDTISTMLTIDDVVLDTIIEKTYYPNPFEFSALPADILGQIYEQFLSERIELTNNRKVQVNLKPDLRKSGGVYYTPRAVVDYIVASTLDPILDGRDHLEVDKLKILDPSCGSGSFLISVYQYLIDWYTDFYSSKPRLAKKYLEIAPDNSLRLKTFKRKQILVNNIYGIDIDAQATEVTKLSLLLKVIEGQNQMELNVGRILPDLDGNIACGNTLIDIDFTIPVNNGIGGVDVYNPFSWSKTWPEIAINGGFDAVVGNPPYLNVDAIWGKNDLRTAYLKSKYSEIYQDKTDLLFYFLKRAHELTKGDVCFIVSRSFLESAKASKLRTWLSENARIREVIDFRKANVFPGVGINTAIVHYTKSLAVKSTNFLRYKNRDLPKAYSIHDLKDSDAFSSTTIPFTDLSDKSWNFGSEEVNTLNKKIDFQGQPIGQILHIGKGMETGRNSAFTTAMTDEEFHFLHQRGLAFKRARNSVIKRYKFDGDCPILFFPDGVSSFDSLPLQIQSHLLEHREELEKRAAYRRGNCEWWQYTWPLHKAYLNRPRIFCPYRADTNRFALDSEMEFLGLTDTTVLYDNGQEEDLRYFVALLNSKIFGFRFRYLAKMLGGGMLEYYENTVAQIRVPRSHPGEAFHDNLVALVEERAQAEFELSTTFTSSDRKLITKVIEKIDANIDNEVAKKLNLTSQEIELLTNELVNAI